MIIETKYNIGGEAYAMSNSFPTRFVIKKVIIMKDDKTLSIQYGMIGGKYFFEEELFPTEEELLK